MKTNKLFCHSKPSRNQGWLGIIIAVGIAGTALTAGFLQIVLNSGNNRPTFRILSDPDATAAELDSLTDQNVRNLRNDTADNLNTGALAGGLATTLVPGADVNTNAARIADALLHQAPNVFSEVVGRMTDPESSWNRNGGSDRPSEGTVPTAGLLPGEVTGGTGDVRISLIWDANSDLDLHVIDPCGFETSFRNKERFCEGLKSELDVDNIPGGPDSVENIFWKTNEAPFGTYMYWVQCFSRCTNTSATYTLIRTIDGVRTSKSGTLRADKEESEIITFTR